MIPDCYIVLDGLNKLFPQKQGPLAAVNVTIDDFRGACAVKGNVQVAGRTSSVSTTEMLSTHDVTLRNVDGSLFHVQI